MDTQIPGKTDRGESRLPPWKGSGAWPAAAVFLRAIIQYHLRINMRSPWYHAGRTLIHTPSFRLEKASAHDAFIHFRVFKRTLFGIWENSPAFEKHNDSQVAVYDDRMKFIQLRKEYIERITGGKAGLSVAKEALLYGRGFLNRTALSITASLFFIVCLPFTPGRRKQQYALIISEVVEAANLLALLRRFSVTTVHHFCIYQKDSNMVSLLLMRSGIFINKIASEGTLFGFKTTVIGDSLSLCFKYQESELDFYKETLFYQSINNWIPEQAFGFMPYYLKGRREAPAGTVGFYTHAAWKRLDSGHIDPGLGDLSAELKLLEVLPEYFRSRPALKLTVYLHPREKGDDSDFRKACRYYEELFRGVRLGFGRRDVSTIRTFAEADTALCSFSTIIFERLFAGYKSILAPFGFEGFPVPGSPLEHICARNADELFVKLDEVLAMDTGRFFSDYKMNGYHYQDYAAFFEPQSLVR